MHVSYKFPTQSQKKKKNWFASAFPLHAFDVRLNMTTCISQQNEATSLKSLRRKGFLLSHSHQLQGF